MSGADVCLICCRSEDGPAASRSLALLLSCFKHLQRLDLARNGLAPSSLSSLFQHCPRLYHIDCSEAAAGQEDEDEDGDVAVN
eukprot:1370202-Rhodomonas_salina.3